MVHKRAVPQRTLHRINPPFLRVLRKHWLLFVMLLPATAYAIIFSYTPMTGIILAFKNYQYSGGIYFSPWVGLENFKFLQIAGKLGMVTRNTLLYNAAFILLGVVFEMGVVNVNDGLIELAPNFVGPRAVENGERAAAWIAEKLNYEGEVAVVIGMPKAFAARQRTLGFVSWMTENAPNITVVETAECRLGPSESERPCRDMDESASEPEGYLL